MTRWTAPTLLEESIEAACGRWGARPAITFGNVTLTYEELGRQVEALRAAYQTLGIRPGDRIVCQFANRPEYLVAVAAAWASGAVHVGTDNDLTGPELSWVVRHTEASALLFEPGRNATDPGRTLAEVRASAPDLKVITTSPSFDDGNGDGRAALHSLPELLQSPPGPLHSGPVRPGPGDPALLHLTSGTTGRPKAVAETLPGCWAKTQFFADAVAPTPDDVHLLFLPTAHVFGLRLALMALLTGGRLVLVDRFSPEGALRTVGDEGVTILPGMPAHFALLLGRLDESRHDVSSLRWAISAAAPLPRALAEQIYQRLDVDLLYVYGCSENFATLTTDRDEILRGSVGCKVFRGPEGTPPNGQIAVIGPDGKRLAPGEVGEIVFGADHPVRYWNAPEAATDGWYRTGDLGRIETDGCVFLHGRLNELINRGGLKVSPTEIETAVARHPGVADAAVIATADPVLGEAICACIVPGADSAAPPDLLELRTFLSSSLARHKLPDELCLVDQIPRTKIGKVERAALSALVKAADLPRERLRPR